MPRHCKLVRLMIFSRTHKLTGVSHNHGGRPRHPIWVPSGARGCVVSPRLPQLGTGIGMWSYSSMLSCARSMARLNRFLSTLPLEGEFEVEFVYRRRRGKKKGQRFAHLFVKPAGTRLWQDAP